MKLASIGLLLAQGVLTLIPQGNTRQVTEGLSIQIVPGIYVMRDTAKEKEFADACIARYPPVATLPNGDAVIEGCRQEGIRKETEEANQRFLAAFQAIRAKNPTAVDAIMGANGVWVK